MKKRIIAGLVLLVVVTLGLVLVTQKQPTKEVATPTSSSVASSSSSSAPEPVYTVSAAEKAYLKTRFEPLKAVNQETIAYIYAPGTMLDEPVVQTTDNATYLDKTFDGGYQPEMGTVFMDMDNRPDFSDRLTWLFGHARGDYVPDHRMFNDVNFYDDQRYFDAHPYVVIETPERIYYYEAMMCIIVPETTPFYRIDFARDADFLAQLEAVKAKAVTQKANLTLSARDRYVVLSTCRQNDSTIRANLYLRQIPDEEMTDFLKAHSDKLTYKATRD